jgi:hypothetical protein
MLLFNTIEGQDPFLYNLGYTEPIKAILGLNVLQLRQCYKIYDWSRLFYVLTKEIQLVLPDGPSSPLLFTALCVLALFCKISNKKIKN